MFNTLKKRIKNEKGLSLVELLAVIVILAIVAAIAIPAIGNIINNSRDKAEISDAINIIAGGKLAHIEKGCGVADSGCTGADLEEFVDGIDVSGIIVKLDENEWVIEKYPFSSRVTTKFTDIKVASTNEQALKTALSGEKDE
ncbi:prepilin-type N-terminal cleavage/methylation domain-containing protein [Solibacillus sp. FSL R5-0691]|uniref:prepilin-type N-terminal cleavage/methylation domain-containing protein n=1 Tax=Solibacillus sp. FSL R5-0691 TaxID=2921653 RepID=UPI0030D13EEC